MNSGAFLIFAKNYVMEEKYTSESVHELLSWARKTLENKDYPEGKYQLNKATTVLDCGKYLESMTSMIEKNWENPTFYPTIDQLLIFREKIKSE